MTHRQKAEMATTSSRPDTCNYHGFAPNVVSTSSGKLTSKIFSSVRIKSCLQKWKDCRSLSWARWQHGRGYKWDLLGMSEDHCLFVFFLTLSNCPYRVFKCTICECPRTTVCLFIPYPIALSLQIVYVYHSLIVLFLTLSHCLYRLFMCTTRRAQFVCFIPYPVALSLQIV